MPHFTAAAWVVVALLVAYLALVEPLIAAGVALGLSPYVAAGIAIAMFGVIHLYQGIPGVLVTAVVGALLAGLYLGPAPTPPMITESSGRYDAEKSR